MLILFMILFPIIAGIAASLMRLPDARSRHMLYGAIVLVTDVLGVLAICMGSPVSFLEFFEGVSLRFAFDNTGALFAVCVMFLYTCVVFYAFEYMQMEEREEVFFAFLFVSLGAMLGVCSSGNLLTLYFCFEAATLSSVELVLHEQTDAAVSAGLKYLFYSIGGALMGLLAVFFVYFFSSGSRDFSMGGILDPSLCAGHEKLLLAIFFIGIVGFGTKAGMYPMHGWLPTAHPIAPAPASSLLSGIIAKAGILAVIRLVFYSIGADFIRGTWVQNVWTCLAMLTVFMGSMMAYREKVTKKRLAYSTISQLSYIMLGLSMCSSEGLQGGLLHVCHHMASKGCLFLCAGVFIYKLGSHHVGELRGIGKKMPITLWCFTIASLSLVGIPPMGGFTSKWHLAMASVGSGRGLLAYLPPVILLISALLTAGYLFPIVVDGFFPGKDLPEQDGAEKSLEPSALMLVPMACLCVFALAVGLFGSAIAGWFHL